MGWLTHISYQPLFYYFAIVWRRGVSLHMSEWVGVLHSSVTIVRGVNFHFTKLVVQTIQKCNFSTLRGQFQDTEIRASTRCLASYSQMRTLSLPWFPLRSVDWTSFIKSNDHEAPYIYFYSEHVYCSCLTENGFVRSIFVYRSVTTKYQKMADFPIMQH